MRNPRRGRQLAMIGGALLVGIGVIWLFFEIRFELGSVRTIGRVDFVTSRPASDSWRLGEYSHPTHRIAYYSYVDQAGVSHSNSDSILLPVAAGDLIQVAYSTNSTGISRIAGYEFAHWLLGVCSMVVGFMLIRNSRSRAHLGRQLV
jgi:hypothetical protein